MKSILILCFICFALCDERGPAYNLKHPDSTTSCMTAGLSEPNGVSDCVIVSILYFGLNKIIDIMIDAAL